MMEGVAQTGVEPSATIFPPFPHVVRQTATVDGIVIPPLQLPKQVVLHRGLFQLLLLPQHLFRPSPATATTDLTESVVRSLEELNVTLTLSIGAALSMDSVEGPRSTAIATLASTTVQSI